MSDANTNCDWCTWNDPQRIDKGTGSVGNRIMSRDHQDYNIVKNGQNTEESPGNLRRLDVTQIPMKDHQLKLA